MLVKQFNTVYNAFRFGVKTIKYWFQFDNLILILGLLTQAFIKVN